MIGSISRLRNSLVDRCTRMGSNGNRNSCICWTKNTRTATIYGICIWSLVWFDIVLRIQRHQCSLLCTTTTKSICSGLPPRYVCLWYNISYTTSSQQIIYYINVSYEKISCYYIFVSHCISQCMISHTAGLHTKHR